jgi:hypothetical protein
MMMMMIMMIIIIVSKIKYSGQNPKHPAVQASLKTVSPLVLKDEAR